MPGWLATFLWLVNFPLGAYGLGLFAWKLTRLICHALELFAEVVHGS